MLILFYQPPIKGGSPLVITHIVPMIFGWMVCSRVKQKQVNKPFNPFTC